MSTAETTIQPVKLENITSVKFGKDYGSYDFANPSRKEWKVWLWVDHAGGTLRISETFEHDVDIDRLVPDDVVDLIEKREAEHWINTSRKETREKIAVLRHNANAVYRAWVVGTAASLRARASKLRADAEELDKSASRYESSLNDLED